MKLPTEVKLEILKFIIPKVLKLRGFFLKNKHKLTKPRYRLPGPHNESNYTQPKYDVSEQKYNSEGYPIYEDGSLNWRLISEDPKAIDFISQNLDKVDWSKLSSNPSAIDILENNQDKIDWLYICINENALRLIENNLDKIDNEGNDAWSWLSLNTNPKVIDLLTKHHPELIMWTNMKDNPGIYEVNEEVYRDNLLYFLY